MANTEIVIIAYKALGGAEMTARKIRAGSLPLHDAALITKDSFGAITIKDSEVRAGEGAAVGALAGALTGLLGGPLGVLLGLVAGAAAGSAAADQIDLGIAESTIQAVKTRLVPESSAFIALLDSQHVAQLENIAGSQTGLSDVVLFREVIRGEVIDHLKSKRDEKRKHPDPRKSKPKRGG